MDTTFDHLVTSDAQSGSIATQAIPLSTLDFDKIPHISTEESILDLSQRSTTTDSKQRFVIMNNWNIDSTCIYTDDISDDFRRQLSLNNDDRLNIEQSLTDQLQSDLKSENSLSDSTNPSQIDLYCSKENSK